MLKIVEDGSINYNGHTYSSLLYFEQLKKDAKVFEFCITKILEEGMTQSMMFDGSVMENGTIVLTNADSVLFDRKEKFEITVADKTYTGEYIGVVAVHADEATGELLEFVCGNLSELYCNGEKILDGNDEDVVYIK